MQHPLVLHHFDQSPFSEKIRVIFGFKGVTWKSVRISRIMPRPELMPLTGGYRRTPVMQIGADIYCDTQTIIRELEARFPAPTLFPGGNAGVPWALGMWTDRSFFQNTVSLVFGTLDDRVPQDFIEDRGRLRGAKFDVKAMNSAIPQMRDQFRAHLGWIEAQLADGRELAAWGIQPRRRQRLYERLVHAVESFRRGSGARRLGSHPLQLSLHTEVGGTHQAHWAWFAHRAVGRGGFGHRCPRRPSNLETR